LNRTNDLHQKFATTGGKDGLILCKTAILLTLFTFAGRISAKREALDAAIFDESMAKAP
jgi:hypothetical protein